MFLNNKTNFWSNYNNYSNFFPKTTIVIYHKLFIVTKIKELPPTRTVEALCMMIRLESKVQHEATAS